MRKLAREGDDTVVLGGAGHAELAKAQGRTISRTWPKSSSLRASSTAGGTSTRGAPWNRSARECA